MAVAGRVFSPSFLLVGKTALVCLAFNEKHAGLGAIRPNHKQVRRSPLHALALRLKLLPARALASVGDRANAAIQSRAEPFDNGLLDLNFAGIEGAHSLPPLWLVRLGVNADAIGDGGVLKAIGSASVIASAQLGQRLLAISRIFANFAVEPYTAHRIGLTHHAFESESHGRTARMNC